MPGVRCVAIRHIGSARDVLGWAWGTHCDMNAVVLAELRPKQAEAADLVEHAGVQDPVTCNGDRHRPVSIMLMGGKRECGFGVRQPPRPAEHSSPFVFATGC